MFEIESCMPSDFYVSLMIFYLTNFFFLNIQSKTRNFLVTGIPLEAGEDDIILEVENDDVYVDL